MSRDRPEVGFLEETRLLESAGSKMTQYPCIAIFLSLERLMDFLEDASIAIPDQEAVPQMGVPQSLSGGRSWTIGTKITPEMIGIR
jgi:hypothetical protein